MKKPFMFEFNLFSTFMLGITLGIKLAFGVPFDVFDALWCIVAFVAWILSVWISREEKSEVECEPILL